MPTWNINLIHQIKIKNDKDTLNDFNRFSTQVTEWEKKSDGISDPWMKRAWKSNSAGLRTHMSGRGMPEYLFRVTQPTTSLCYFMGRIRYMPSRQMDISEVISNQSPEEFLQAFEAEIEEEKRNPFQTPESINAMRKRVQLTREDTKNSVPLGCLFTWAAINSNGVTLTANTVGLISLYEKFGFKLDDPNDKTLKFQEEMLKAKEELQKDPKNKELSNKYNDAKFAEVNAAMKLSAEGRELLLSNSKCQPIIHFLGPSYNDKEKSF